MNNTRRKNILTTAITLLFVVIITATALLNTAVAWTKDNQLTGLSGEPECWDMKPSVMQSHDGKIWVFWSSDMLEAQYEIYYKTSVDNGSTWSGATRFTWDDDIDDTPYAMQTRNGTLWVFWASYRTGNFEIFYMTSTDGGLEWSWDAFQFTNDSLDDSFPSVTQNVDGTIFVIWQREMGVGDVRLFYKTSSDEGMTWSDETPFILNSWDVSPSVTWTYNGTLWVVWSHYNLTEDHYDLLYKTTSNNGLSWSDAHRLTTDPVWDISPSVLQAPDGKMWVFWSRGVDQYDIYYKTSIDYGSNWSPDTLLTKSAGSEEDPKATTTKDRKILVVWSSTRVDFDIYYKISDEINPVHDIAINDITAWVPRGFNQFWVPRGMPVYVNVTVENQGTSEENFNVTVYADRNIGDLHIDIGTQNISLASETTTILNFTWDTTNSSYGSYYISANATVVSGEYDTADNVMIAGAKIGGICVPWQPKVTVLVVLSRTALSILVIVGLGIVAISFFKLLMSV